MTVVIDITPDRGNTTFSVLIPTINLDNSNSADVNTIGIATRHETTIGGPNVPGQVDTYTVQSLTGKAQFKVN